MAVRGPTAYTKYLDGEAIRSGKPILENEWDEALNDQSFMLNHEQIVVSDCFWRWRSYTDDPAWDTVAICNLDSIDKCDATLVGASQNHNVAVYCKCDADTTGTWRLESNPAIAADSVESAFTNTTWNWIGSDATTAAILAGGSQRTEELWTLKVKRTAGSGYVWIAGIIILADET
jgi:hypothetical protein